MATENVWICGLETHPDRLREVGWVPKKELDEAAVELRRVKAEVQIALDLIGQGAQPLEVADHLDRRVFRRPPTVNVPTVEKK